MVKNVLIVLLLGGILVLGYLLYSGKSISEITITPKPAENAQHEDKLCAQVITSARHPEKGDITEFPTPCDVPQGWEVIQNDVPGLDLEVQ